MGRHMYPPAPDMRQSETQQMTDGQLFFVIQNGIRMTGMPAWGSGSQHDEEDSWKLVRFIRHLPQLTAAEEIKQKAEAEIQAYVERLERSPRYEYRRNAEGPLDYNCAFAAALHNATSSEQRRTAAARLRGYEMDLRALAAEAAS